MEDDLTSSVFRPEGRYEYASVYVDAGGSSRVIARLQELIGVEGGERYLTVGPVRVYGTHNDYATGRKAHPFDFLEWPTVLECEATAGSSADVVAAIADVLQALWRGGFKAGERPSMGAWWKNLLTFRKSGS